MNLKNIKELIKNKRKTLFIHFLGFVFISSTVLSILFFSNEKAITEVSTKIYGINSLDTNFVRTILHMNCQKPFLLSKDNTYLFFKMNNATKNSCSISLDKNFQRNLILKMTSLVKQKYDLLTYYQSYTPKDYGLMHKQDGGFVRELTHQLSREWYTVRFENVDLLPLGTRDSFLTLRKAELKKILGELNDVDSTSDSEWQEKSKKGKTMPSAREVLGVLILIMVIYYSLLISTPPLLLLFKK